MAARTVVSENGARRITGGRNEMAQARSGERAWIGVIRLRKRQTESSSKLSCLNGICYKPFGDLGNLGIWRV